MSSMLFCPRCANILPLRADAGQLAFACATCPYQFTVQSDMEYRTMGKKRAVAQVEGQQTEGQYDATDFFACEAPRKALIDMLVTCPKCFHKGAYFEERQTRSADEAATIYYTCEKCKYPWNTA